jgi:DNA (cytosine-5)-methyltransferase 1
MTFLDFFAGIGGFRRGMEMAGHKCVGFCEFDKFAVMSYTSMHLITDEQREYLSTLPVKERQKEILKSEYRNGEWYANDIRTVNAGDIPGADCWCFGFPCQDISVAGKQVGFYGNRSSLFFRVMYLLGQQEEEKRPTYLLIENVKNLLSVNGGWDFARLLIEMDRNGYDAEWQVLNSKHYGVPQNRERVFIVGCLRGRGGREVFPFGSSNEKTDIEVIGWTRESTIKDRTRILSGGNKPDTEGDRLQRSCEGINIGYKQKPQKTNIALTIQCAVAKGTMNQRQTYVQENKTDQERIRDESGPQGLFDRRAVSDASNSGGGRSNA